MSFSGWNSVNICGGGIQTRFRPRTRDKPSLKAPMLTQLPLSSRHYSSWSLLVGALWAVTALSPAEPTELNSDPERSVNFVTTRTFSTFKLAPKISGPWNARGIPVLMLWSLLRCSSPQCSLELSSKAAPLLLPHSCTPWHIC